MKRVRREQNPNSNAVDFDENFEEKNFFNTLNKDVLRIIIYQLTLMDALSLSQVCQYLRSLVITLAREKISQLKDPVLNPYFAPFAVTLDCRATLFSKPKRNLIRSKVPDRKDLTILKADEVYNFLRSHDDLAIWKKLHQALGNLQFPSPGEMSSIQEKQNLFSVWFEQNIMRLELLEKLSLREMSIAWLPNEFRKLKNLSYLDLSKNALFKLPTELEDLKELRILDLSYNKLQSLPSWLNNLSKLEKVILTGNPLSNKFTSLLSNEMQYFYFNGAADAKFELQGDDLRQLCGVTRSESIIYLS